MLGTLKGVGPRVEDVNLIKGRLAADIGVPLVVYSIAPKILPNKEPKNYAGNRN